MTTTSTTITPIEIRQKLERVLKDKVSLSKSAKISFQQFDKDKSGSLDYDETKSLIQRLFKNLQLPPMQDCSLEKIFYRYDDGDHHLTINEFSKLYYDLLLRIRDAYYPEKKFKVRRSFFIGRTSLSGKKKIQDVLTFERKLGSGSYGHVYLVKEKGTQLERVCKIINKNRAAMPVEQIEAEIEFMKNLDHPHVIKIYDVYEDYNNIYIIMEICSGGELMKRIMAAQNRGKVLNERYVAQVMRNILEAIAYVHSQKVAHKDLKPENIMFQDDSKDAAVKVIDFGVAEMFESKDFSRSAAGTALYMAPEVYKRRFGLKCDVWSSGCIMYLMLTCRLPFNGRTVPEMGQKVCHTEPRWDVDCRGVSANGRSLLKRMLDKDPQTRPSASEVLQDEWFDTAPEVGATLSPDVLQNMQHYMKGTSLKHVLGNMLSHQLNVNGTKIRNIIKLFKSLDSDADGSLSHEELTTGLSQAGWSQWDINKIVQALDVDDSGGIAYTEFLSACYSWQDEEIDVVWSAFQKMDTSGDGRISLHDLGKALGADNYQYGDEEDIGKLLQEIDKDKNGFVDWDEFLGYMRDD